MTTETRTSALDPFLTTRAQFDFMLAAPEPQLLIDGDNLTVTNALDRTDDPAVLITGSNNTFINQTGATLTGTGVDPTAPDAAIEISGAGNRVENQSGATIAGTGGVFSSAANTHVVNDGDIVSVNSGSSFFDDRGFAVRLDTDSSVVNTGFMSAQGVDEGNIVRTISMGDRAVVDNSGTVEATGEFAAAVEVGANSSVVNTGTVSSSATLDGTGIVAVGPGSTVHNHGVARGTSSDAFSNAFGIASASRGDETALVWNGGIAEADATGGGSAQGVVVQGGRFVNEGTVTARATVGSDLGSALGAFMIDANGENSGTITAFSDGTLAAGVAITFEAAFDNSGHVSATGPQAFGLSTFDLATVINSGTVTATSLPGAPAGTSVGIDGRNGMSVENTGMIRVDAAAEATGISAVDGSSIQNGGRIEAAASTATGIKVGADATVVTTGVLRAEGGGQGDAIVAGDRATIQTGGTVEATGDFGFGVQAGMDSMVSNTGLLRAAAVGLAQGVTAGDGSVVQNADTGVVEVAGDEAFGLDVGFLGTIVNAGTVEVSATGFASGLSGRDSFTVENLGTVRAEVTGEIAAGFGIFAPTAAVIVNRGTIDTITDDGTVTAVLLTAIEGRVENHGQLRATSTGTSATSRADALILDGGVAVNAGSISASAESGFSSGAILGVFTELTNTGEITATGPNARGVELGPDSTLDNSGTIAAFGPMSNAVFAEDGARIVNSGNISADAGTSGLGSIGVAFGELSIAPKSIQNSGTIAADIAVLDGAPSSDTDTLTLVNSGQITGTVDLGNGVDIVRNTGMIDGDVLLGAGDDEFDGRGGTVTGVVDGGDGNDVIRGGAGNDTLMGGAGNDIVAGGAGADVMDGGTRDTSVFGFDALDYSESNAGVQVNLGDATQSTSAPIKGAAGTGFGGHAEGDTFQNFQKVIGSAFDDFVYGADGGSVVELGDGNDTFDNDATLFTEDTVDLGAGNDIARTGAGDDLVEGGAGNDLLQGEDGGDWLLGGDGNDLLIGGAGADQLDGGADADALFGGTDADSLFGEAGDDLLSGGEGDDLLDGGTGNDLLLGGGGDDLFNFGTDGGQDRIIGFDAGAGTGDVVDLSAFDSILSFDDVLAIASETGSGAGVSTVLTFDMATTLTFQGVRLTELNEADFLIV